MKKLKLIAEAVPEISYICLDVANGYSEHFVDCVRKARRGPRSLGNRAIS